MLSWLNQLVIQSATSIKLGVGDWAGHKDNLVEKTGCEAAALWRSKEKKTNKVGLFFWYQHCFGDASSQSWGTNLSQKTCCLFHAHIMHIHNNNTEPGIAREIPMDPCLGDQHIKHVYLIPYCGHNPKNQAWQSETIKPNFRWNMMKLCSPTRCISQSSHAWPCKVITKGQDQHSHSGLALLCKWWPYVPMDLCLGCVWYQMGTQTKKKSLHGKARQ